MNSQLKKKVPEHMKGFKDDVFKPVFSSDFNESFADIAEKLQGSKARESLENDDLYK